MSHTIDLLDTDRYRPVAKPKGRVRRALERGNTTAEYAVGILAAVSFALVLLKVITHNDFFTTMLKFVLKVLASAAAQIK